MWAHAYVPRHLLETRLAMFGKDIVYLSNKLWRGHLYNSSDYYCCILNDFPSIAEISRSRNTAKLQP